jgi:hypothetical protein
MRENVTGLAPVLEEAGYKEKNEFKSKFWFYSNKKKGFRRGGFKF